MTKQEFWYVLASHIKSCDYCPVRIHVQGDSNKCKGYGNCFKALELLYSQLKDSEGDKTDEVSL